jgi:hypothetical protein
MTKHHNVLRKEQPVPHSLREPTHHHPRIEWGYGREPQRTPSDDRAYHEDEVPLLSPNEPRGLKSSLRKLNPHHRRLKSVRFWSSSEQAAVGKEADSTSVDTQWPSSRNANVLQRDRDRALQASRSNPYRHLHPVRQARSLTSPCNRTLASGRLREAKINRYHNQHRLSSGKSRCSRTLHKAGTTSSLRAMM